MWRVNTSVHRHDVSSRDAFVGALGGDVSGWPIGGTSICDPLCAVSLSRVRKNRSEPSVMRFTHKLDRCDGNHQYSAYPCSDCHEHTPKSMTITTSTVTQNGTKTDGVQCVFVLG